MGYLDKDGLSRAFTKLKTLIDKKADVGHSHTKNQLGLGNVDNTADANKSVKYASSAGYASFASKANGIVVSDTRNDNSAPNDAAFDKNMLTADFKYGSKIGSPTGFNGTYCGVLSLAPWSETNGGHGYQLAFGYEKKGHPRLALRGSDLSATSWNSWYKVYTSDDKPTLSELGAAAASHSHTKSQITDFAHTHDDRYYTESEIDTKLSGKAASSHKHAAADITSVNASAITGTIAAANLPSYVDDVLEYAGTSKFPSTGEAGKIYTDTTTNKTYRWGGSSYVVISDTIALGETASTAYRGDRGVVAYNHAAAKGSAFASGLYKITTNEQGHVTAATAVQKSDITALGIKADITIGTAKPTSSTSGIFYIQTN